MPELETLFVRIEADLSEFKRGLAVANRETRGFANEAKRAFSEVGSALNLSRFRKELAESERAAASLDSDIQSLTGALAGKSIVTMLSSAMALNELE